MILRGLGLKEQADNGTIRARAPDRSLIYAVGDIHGRADLLIRLHDMIQADAGAWPDYRKVVVYLGDYIDRGLESSRVIEILISDPLAGFTTVPLKGNHEAFLLRFLVDESVGPAWLANGGDAALYSYGIPLPESHDPAERLRRLRQMLLERLPASHLDFFRALSVSHIEGDYFFVHAGIRPGRALDNQDEADMLWIRDGFLRSRKNHGKIVVHGHSISAVPEFRPNRIGIDTGAFASGTLTCLVLHDDQTRILQTLA